MNTPRCDNGRGHNLPGFLLCKLRVPAREEKVQGVLQSTAQSYSKQSPNIRVNRVVRLLFAMSSLVHKARSTSPYIIFDPGGVNTSLCATSEQLLFRLVKYLTIEYYDATQHHMKMQPAAAALAAMLHEWEVLELRSAYKLKLQAVQGVGYIFSGVTKNGAIERYGGEEASKTVYPYFKVDNFSVDRSEHVKGCCLYYSAFRIPFDPSSALDGVLGIQLSEAIPSLWHIM
nr:uncharacterized protein LOC117275838 [Nicotiana tomentosiformis]